MLTWRDTHPVKMGKLSFIKIYNLKLLYLKYGTFFQYQDVLWWKITNKISYRSMQLGMHDMDIPCLKNLNYLVIGEIINITILYILGKQLKNEQSQKKKQKRRKHKFREAYIINISSISFLLTHFMILLHGNQTFNFLVK